jgi:hypothetical protein
MMLYTPSYCVWWCNKLGRYRSGLSTFGEFFLNSFEILVEGWNFGGNLLRRHFVKNITNWLRLLAWAEPTILFEKEHLWAILRGYPAENINFFY